MAAGLKRIAVLALLIVALPACETSNTKPDKPKPDLLEIYNLAATAYAEQNWADAEKYYITLTQESPGETEPWFKLGNIYARTRRLDAAIRAYREVLVRDSAYVKAWHNMAILQLREAGNSFEALELLVGPDDPLHEKSVRIQKAIDELVN